MKKLIAISSLFLATIACSTTAQPTATAVPTQTFSVTATLAPKNTPTEASLPPTATEDVHDALVPTGQPDAEWNGIPIMPGAITGEGDAEGYVFTIQATPEQIRDYYQNELSKLGWQALASGDGEASQMLIFTNDSGASLSVSIITKGEEALVILVK